MKKTVLLTRHLFLTTAMALVLTTASTVTSKVQAAEFINIAGGSSGGTYIIVATGIAKILTKYVKGLKANAEVTGGGFANTPFDWYQAGQFWADDSGCGLFRRQRRRPVQTG